MPQADPILQLFEDTGAYLKGHFRLTSGLHSGEYLQCARVLQYPPHAEQLGRLLGNRLEHLASPAKIGLVVSPALGGLIIGHEVARALGTPFVFTERVDGKMALRRGFRVDAGTRAVVVEDVITTGGSTREVIATLEQEGARVIGAGSIIDRSGGTVDVGVARVALATLAVTSYEAGDCPLCRDGMPIVKPGSRVPDS